MLAKPRTIAHRLLLVSFVLPLSACIGIQGNDAREFESFPPRMPDGPKFNVAVSATVVASRSAATEEMRTGTASKVETWAKQELYETGRMAYGASGGYNLNFYVIDQGCGFGSILMSMVSGLTLTVLPASCTHEYTTQVTLTDASGETIGETTHKHHLQWVTELFLVFGMPFAGSEAVFERMWEQVLRDVAVWTVEQVSAQAS